MPLCPAPTVPGTVSGWTAVNTGLPLFGEELCPILEVRVDPDDPERIWAGTQYSGGIVKTEDGGLNWQAMGLTDQNTVDAIAVNPEDSSQIIAGAGYWNGSLFKSSDGGSTWQEKLSGISFVTDLAFHPQNPNIVYAATEGMSFLRSADGGETWQSFGDGIFYPILYSLAVGSNGLIVTGSYGSGLYWRTDSEAMLLFADGFESGDLSAWSLSVP